MPPEPVPADPGQDDDPAWFAAEPEGPWWPDEEYLDPEDCVPPPEEELTPQELVPV